MVEWVDRGEDDGVDDDRISLGLIGKVWTNRNPNPVAFISTMKGIWWVKNRVDIVNIGRNLYQIQFFHWRDKKKILEGQPWHFDKYPLLLEEMDKAVKPSDLEFYHLPIWARFYDVPFKGRNNIDNARMLGNKVGMFMDVAKPDGYGIDKSMRVRVKIDVRQPLRDSVRLKIRDGQVCKIPVKYERLPMICFYCGRLGHVSNDCVEVSGDSTPERKYGPSLRASPWKFVKEDDGSARITTVNGKGVSCDRKLFVTQEMEKVRRLEDKKLVDEVADFLNKVSLEHVDDGSKGAKPSCLNEIFETEASGGLGMVGCEGVAYNSRQFGEKVGMGSAGSLLLDVRKETVRVENGDGSMGESHSDMGGLENRIKTRRWKRRGRGKMVAKVLGNITDDCTGKRKQGLDFDMEARVPRVLIWVFKGGD